MITLRQRLVMPQCREQGPVCPVQLRVARLPPLQDRELVAQDQDFGGLRGLRTPG
jgi:hypothetical protein